MRVRSFGAVVLALSARVLAAQDAALLGPLLPFSDAQLQAILSEGAAAKGKPQGLSLKGTSVGQRLLGSHGFSVRLYTPADWIRQQASDAAKDSREFAARDVSDDMRQAIVRVFVYADMPFQGAYVSGHSVQHVFLLDAALKNPVQPLATEPFSEDGVDGNTYQGLTAVFALADVQRLSEGGNALFKIQILGDSNKQKTFDVGAKKLTLELPAR